nr:hypothetical protein [Treponemataceae bacterium]
MKKMKNICIVFLTIFLLFQFNSCQNLNDSTASVIFNIDGKLVSAVDKRLHSRASVRKDSEKLYLDISLKGTFEQIQTLELTEGASAVFEEVPVGSKIYAHVIAYDKPETNGSSFPLYEGDSDTIFVSSGENVLNVKIKETSTSIKIYVNSTRASSHETDCGSGTEEKPFTNLESALSTIMTLNRPENDYTIILSGTREGFIYLQDSITVSDDSTTGEDTSLVTYIPANSITIEGKTGPSVDVIDGACTSEDRNPAILIDTVVPLTIRNITITGGYSGNGGGICMAKDISPSSLILENCVITGNIANDNGGGIYVGEECKLTVKDGVVVDQDKSTLATST